MGRQRKKVSFIGQPFVGKSTQIEKMLLHRVELTGEPWIIYDPSRQARWLKYAEISLNMYKGMRKGIYRITPEVEWQEFFDATFNHFKGGQVLCEDAGHYLPERKDDEIYSNLIALRHPDHDIDITFTTHNITETPKFLLRNANEVILFKTGDNWKDCRDRIRDDKVDEFEKAFIEVNADPDPHAWRRITLLKTGTK